MPFKSEKQRRFFNSPTGKAKIGAEKVAEFNQASQSADLPEYAGDMQDNPVNPDEPMPKKKKKISSLDDLRAAKSKPVAPKKKGKVSSLDDIRARKAVLAKNKETY